MKIHSNSCHCLNVSLPYAEARVPAASTDLFYRTPKDNQVFYFFSFLTYEVITDDINDRSNIARRSICESDLCQAVDILCTNLGISVLSQKGSDEWRQTPRSTKYNPGLLFVGVVPWALQGKFLEIF